MTRVAMVALLAMFSMACGNLDGELREITDAAGPGKKKDKDRAKEGKRKSGGGDRTAPGPKPNPGGRGSPVTGVGCEAFPRSGGQVMSFAFDGQSYDMEMSAPKGSGERHGVILLHGGKGGPSSIVKQTQMFPRAVDHGFVAIAPGARSVMLPKGEARERWKNGDMDNDPSVKYPRDDVAFLDALAKHMRDDMCVDKVLAVGFSNGGSMGHRWLCEGKQLDALVSAAGTLQVPKTGCNKSAKPVLEYIGTSDRRMNEPATPGSGNPSALETLDFWKEFNGCTGKAEVMRQGDTKCQSWSSCKSGAPTRLCVIEGLGHSFPRKSDCDLEGSDDAWDWFNEVI